MPQVGDELSETYMASAMHYWSIRGHNADIYVHEPPPEYCDTDFIMPGFIKMKKAKFMELDPETLASTTRQVANLQIIGAEITWRKSALKLELVYIHELGHAFGYGHVDIRNHIMQPIYDYMGKAFFIP